MEFWGVEVKPGETVKCDPGEDKYLHLSQASLGEVKKDKGNENVPIFVKFNDQKLVLGTLSAEKCAQISYDLVFEKEFELCHSSKNTSVYFCGYKTVVADDDETDDFPDSDFDSDEDIQLGQKVNGKTEVKDERTKPSTGKVSVKVDASAAKPKVKIEEANKADKQKADKDDEVDDDDESEEDESEDVSDDDEDMAEAEDESDDVDEDASSDEEDEATPQKVESGKKRPAGSASKTPAPEKKAKLVSPVGSQKTGGDGKKGGGHTATPHPAKYAGKTPATSDKSKQQTPKSAGSVSCKSCSKTFNSENALQAHTKAKHAAAK
ncbi:histone deacetylase HDT2-like [Phoenix dactylifera]|uniref:Histone deacetylase HDT2-like n=1 Tax=Phoenix dactylifera TaxID=42345 RepID=A0A8B7BKI1_PHODC|nr:histone deacetylase HDT2-like [Phoenix dactylifera]